MKKKILCIILTALALTATGCANANTTINVSSDKESGTKQVGIGQLRSIDDSYLYYDTNTNIVYFWNGHIENKFYDSTAPSPYYAPNGLPYKYNPTTNTLEEIQEEE